MLWKRYVDDCIAIVPTDKINEILQYINSINDSIQFTHEIENDNKLAFLDIMIEK
jgi:hypothetical protein